MSANFLINMFDSVQLHDCTWYNYNLPLLIDIHNQNIIMIQAFYSRPCCTQLIRFHQLHAACNSVT